jgi:serine/threonine protein kinase
MKKICFDFCKMEKIFGAVTEFVGGGDDRRGQGYMLDGRRYVTIKKLGEGGYSFVYLVEEEVTRERYALKKLVVDESEQRDKIEEEINVMKALPAHANILNLISYGLVRHKNSKETCALLLLPLCAGGSLYDRIAARYAKKEYFPEHIIARWFLSLCNAIAVLHSARPPIAHRDVKVESMQERKRDARRGFFARISLCTNFFFFFFSRCFIRWTRSCCALRFWQRYAKGKFASRRAKQVCAARRD